MTKARQLNLLTLKALNFVIPKLIFFSAISFKEKKLNIFELLKLNFETEMLIVRSSAEDEDKNLVSSAGKYVSVLNVPSNNPKEITTAINKVISSYQQKRPLLEKDEVIIQAMVQNTSMSGVIFTHDINTGAPYYVINYDDQSGLTDTVTSGDGEYSNRTLYIHRNYIKKLRSERFAKLLRAVKELEKVLNSQFLDIEFALGEDLTPYLLQVRAITTQPNWDQDLTKRIDISLDSVKTFVSERFKKSSGVHGITTILGQMPDWNPVELIGRAPRALATSLYQRLITDDAWRIGRSIMGYKTPSGQPLMVTLAGQPFIDTRLSFHSFLPQDLSPNVSEKIVNKWIGNLKSSPELHDKVEFEIAITTYSFDIDEKIEKLIGNILTKSEKEEFKNRHFFQTSQLLKGENDGSINNALKKIDLLNDIHKNSNSFYKEDNLSLLIKMIDDCIHFGTIPFATLARHGFIAKTILLSLKNIGILTEDNIHQIQANVKTVASELVDDMDSLQIGNISNHEFMSKYGHLRPGTYDIMSQRYDQMTNLFDQCSKKYSKKEKFIKSFVFSYEQQEKIDKVLLRHGFSDFNAENLLEYIQDAIVGREYGKFVFTRSVSNILEFIAAFAEKNGLSRDEVSHIPINTILNITSNSSNESVEKILRKVSSQESKNHDITVAIRLPQLLVDEIGVHIIPFQVSHPNFITNKTVIAPCVILNSKIDEVSLDGNIVIIEGADPGFDWIFSQKIVGLITKYGGANSHMAIRCAEFGIPAAIGCGEQRFELLIKSNRVHLDCASGLINQLH